MWYLISYTGTVTDKPCHNERLYVNSGQVHKLAVLVACLRGCNHGNENV